MRNKRITRILLVLILFSVFPIVSANAYSGGSGCSGKIIIVRDNYGVPHIFASTKEGLAFGAGYAMAQDRLWQADLYRRQAFGSLAEFGFASIDQDYATRSIAYSKEELLQIFNNWTPTQPKARLKEMMLSYVDGINLYISEALTALANGDPSLMPIEYLPGVITPNGLPLVPFTIEDCTAIVVMMAWRFGGTGGNELSYAAALQALMAMHGEETGWQIFNDQYPQVDPGAPTTIPSQEKCTHKTLGYGSIPQLPCNIGNNYKNYEKSKIGQMELYESMGLPTKFGSNAWMVSPWKSETRNAMQVGGPQMGHSIPQIVLEIGLHGAGINAVGMMMPHAPTILIGVSQHGAWTSTTGASDVIDTYIEVLNPENQYQYWYNGEWVDMEKRTETFSAYWSMGYSENRDIYRTIHGPIVAWDLTNNLCYTMKSPYYKNELAAEEGWSLFQQAKNIRDMNKACKEVHPNHNFFWIDKRGNIGYWHSGRFPIKPTYGKNGRFIDDRFPLWGTGEEEWIGVTGFKEIPKCINPKQGFLANWNNKPQADWPYTEADWGEVHRVTRIQELLAAGKFTFDDMGDINRDAGYNHIPGMYFLDYLTEAAKTDPSIPPEVIMALEGWDHHYNDVIDPRYPNPSATYDDPGLTIFDRWFSKIDNEVFDDDLPPGVGGSDSTLLHVFDGENSKLALNYDYLNGEDRDEVIVRVLKEVLEDLELEFGPDISTWLTPVMTITFSPLGALPSPKMHAMNRGTYNHIAEMPRIKWGHWWCKPAKAVNVIPPGQSGFVHLVDGVPTISPHAYDQLLLYETWTYKPVLLRYRDIWEVAESKITL
ncbi:MAG: penicillin acylase family protein [Candidatus Hodarchaeota archaeon]